MKRFRGNWRGRCGESFAGSLYSQHCSRFWRDGVLSLVIATFLMSPVSMRFFTFGGRYIPEPIYFLVVGASGFYVFREVFNSRPFLLRFALVYGLVAAGFFVIGFLKFGDFVPSYGNFRAVLILLLAVIYGAWFRNRAERASMLHALCMYGFIITFACPYFLTIEGSETVKNAIPIMAGLVAICIALVLGEVTDVLFDLVVIDVACCFSFYRGYMLAAAILSLMVCVVMLPRLFSSRSTLQYKAVLVVFSLGLFFLVPFVYDSFTGVVALDESKYIQSVGKINDIINLFNGEATLAASEQNRVDYFSYIWANWSTHIIPGGFCSTTSLSGSGSTIMPLELPYGNSLDSFFVYVFFHAGSLSLIGVFPLLLYIVLRLIESYSWIVGGGLFLVFFIYLNMAAEYLTVATKAVPMGLFFGYCVLSGPRWKTVE